MIIDNSADFCLLDNLGPLTLQVAGLPDVSIPAAVSMPAEYAELDPSGGNVLKGDQCFAWPQNASPRPPLGSTILDAAGDAWTVLAVDAKGDVKTWDCHARNLKIANRLDNTAAVWEASYAKSPGGEALPAWTQVLSGIAARFQPVEQSAQVLEDAEWPKTVYHVLLGDRHFRPADSRRAGLGRLSPGRFRGAAFPHRAVPAGGENRRPAAGGVRACY